MKIQLFGALIGLGIALSVLAQPLQAAAPAGGQNHDSGQAETQARVKEQIEAQTRARAAAEAKDQPGASAKVDEAKTNRHAKPRRRVTVQSPPAMNYGGQRQGAVSQGDNGHR